MRADNPDKKVPIFRRRPVIAWAAALIVCAAVLSAVAPAHGLWMPWATEIDKIKKVISEIWVALLAGNETALKKHLDGTRAKSFTDQERDRIVRLNIRDYKFRIRRANVDNLKQEWAWIALDRIAIMAHGGVRTMSSMMVFRKVDGDWKLHIGDKKPRKKKEEPEKEASSLSGKTGTTQKRVPGPGTVSATKQVGPVKTPNISAGRQWQKGPVPGEGPENVSQAGALLQPNRKEKPKQRSSGFQWIKGPVPGHGPGPAAKPAPESVGNQRVEPVRNSSGFQWKKGPLPGPALGHGR